jgi:hypothetical protein
MFVQVIDGRVSDRDRARAALDEWVKELAPGATGWLGTTAGVADDGRFVALARFDTAENAARNSNRPEQDAWWRQTAQLFDGEPTFSDSRNVMVDVNGDPDHAGFVQVMRGQGNDPDRARQLMSEDSTDWQAFRPEIIGSVAVEHDGGAYTMAMYFTSEAEAREGEKKEPPPELQKQMEEMNALQVGVPEFIDLREPWLYSSG